MNTYRPILQERIKLVNGDISLQQISISNKCCSFALSILQNIQKKESRFPKINIKLFS